MILHYLLNVHLLHLIARPLKARILLVFFTILDPALLRELAKQDTASGLQEQGPWYQGSMLLIRDYNASWRFRDEMTRGDYQKSWVLLSRGMWWSNSHEECVNSTKGWTCGGTVFPGHATWCLAHSTVMTRSSERAWEHLDYMDQGSELKKKQLYWS